MAEASTGPPGPSCVRERLTTADDYSLLYELCPNPGGQLKLKPGTALCLPSIPSDNNPPPPHTHTHPTPPCWDESVVLWGHASSEESPVGISFIKNQGTTKIRRHIHFERDFFCICVQHKLPICVCVCGDLGLALNRARLLAARVPCRLHKWYLS